MGVVERGVRIPSEELAGEAGPEYFEKDEEMVGVAEGNFRVIDDLPQIDISLLSDPCPATAAAEAQKLGAALSGYGFCFLINHGMSSQFLDSLRGIMDDFSHLPLEEKLKWEKADQSAIDNHFNEGYGFDVTPQGCGAQEWCDRLIILVSPESQSQLHHCPDNPSNLREIMKECSSKVEKLSFTVLKGMARSLGLEEEGSFVEEIGEPRILASFNFYPKCSRPDRVLGVKSHSDGGALTFLLQDKQVEGLQMMLKDGEWVRVPIVPVDALVLNLGDIGEIISNGEFRAPKHRATVSAERTRKSLAFFTLPRLGKTYGPAKGLVDESRPAKYKEVTDYELLFRQQPYYGEVLDSVKV